MTPATMRVSEVLRKARALIETPAKWCKGSGRDGHARCANTAIHNAAPDTEYWAAARGRLERHACPGIALTVWNDHPSTTHALMMRGFDVAIAAAERDEAGQTPGA